MTAIISFQNLTFGEMEPNQYLFSHVALIYSNNPEKNHMKNAIHLLIPSFRHGVFLHRDSFIHQAPNTPT